MTNFGVVIFDGYVSDLVARSQVLEKLGYDSVWLTDETMVFGTPPEMIIPEIFPTMAAIALGTSRIRIGSGVVDASMRYPVKTAQSIATVDSMAGGRTIWGIGAGEAVNREPFGVPLDHVFKRMEEAVRCIRMLLLSDHSHPVNFSGEFYSLKNAYLKMKPARKPYPPLVISAFGPNALALAGQLGDGWLSFNHTPKTFNVTLNGPVKTAAEKVGRDVREIEPTMVVAMAMSRERERARRMAAAVAKDWLVWSPDILKSLLPDFDHPGTRQTLIKRDGPAAIDYLSKLSSKIPDEVAVQTTISGNADDCMEGINSFIKAGVKRFIVFPVLVDGKGWKEIVDEFSTHVVKQFG